MKSAITIANKYFAGTNSAENWQRFFDPQNNRLYYYKCYFYSYGGNDQLGFHGDSCIVNMGLGNDSVAFTGANNTLTLHDGDDVVNPVGKELQISNKIYAGNGNDRITLNGIGNFVDLGTGNDTAVIRGNSNTVDDGLGNDNITFIGDFNSTTSSQSNQNDKVTIRGSNNSVDWFSTYGSGGGTIDVAGHNNWVAARNSKIVIGYLSQGPARQVTNVSGEYSTIDWNLTSTGKYGQIQDLNVITYLGGELDTPFTEINANVKEASTFGISIDRGQNVLYLNGLTSVKENFNFYVSLKSPSSTLGIYVRDASFTVDSNDASHFIVSAQNRIVGSIRVLEKAANSYLYLS